MARSDFNWVPIFHEFTGNGDSITKEFPIEGSQAPSQDDAYLLIQVRDVKTENHQIAINGKPLSGIDLPSAPGESKSWLTWMKHVDPNILKLGTNTITITQVGDDRFEIGGIVVNWREP